MQTGSCWVQAKKNALSPSPIMSALILSSQQQIWSFWLAQTFRKKDSKKKQVRAKSAKGLGELLQPAPLCICRLVAGCSKILQSYNYHLKQTSCLKLSAPHIFVKHFPKATNHMIQHLKLP